MNRFALLCMILLGLLPSFAATNVHKIAPQNRFQFTPPAAWAKAGTHSKAQTALPGGGKAKESRLAAKSAKTPPAPGQPCAQRFHPGIPNLPVGKLGFLAAQQIPVGGGIYNSGASLGGDFNGDGKQDLVTQVETNRNSCPSYWISAVLSNGDGTFQAPVLTAIPNNDSCARIAVGDLNGDGKDDILVVQESTCSEGTSSIDVMIGNGDGSFTQGANYPVTNTNLVGGVVADVSSDGKLDLLVVDQAIPANVWTLLGNGNGTFQTPTSIALSGTSGNGDVFSDLNGDGLLDIAEMDSDTNELTIYMATSATSYASAVSYDSSDSVHDACSLTAGDLSGDGKAEIVNANCYDNTLTVYVNNGDGSFQTGVYYAGGSSVPSGTTADLYPQAVTIADVNSDGKADIVSINDDSADVTILLGNGDGTVTVPSIGYAVGGYPQLPAIVGDFNGDGNIDLVVPDLEYSLVFLKGYGDGSFRSPLDYFSPIPSDNPSGVTVATGDFNGDGNPDFVLGNCCGTQAGITVFLSRADGSLLPGVNYVSANSSQSLQYVTVADFNKDGKLDIAAADSDNSVVQIFNGVGDGTFTVGVSVATGGSYEVPTGILSGDFNHDGFPDIAVASDNDGSSDVRVLLNDGTGNFAVPVSYDFGATFNDVGMAAADLNHDGNLDLVVPLAYGSVVAILLGNADGTFQPEADLSIPSSVPVGAAVGDFNGDGIPDLAVTLAQDGTNGVAVALGVGDGTFAPPVIYLSTLQDQTYDTPQPIYIQAADIDGDGKLDLIYTNSNYATVGILFGIGDGTFYAPVEFPAGGYAYGLALADVNHDGTLDVVTGNDDYSGVTTLFNLNGAGTVADYGVTTSTPAVTVTAGGSAVYNLTISPANHYNGLVTMSCGTLPPLTTCSFSPASFQMDGHTPVAVQLTVTTTAVGASLREPARPKPGSGSPMLLAALGSMGLFGMLLSYGRKRSSHLPAVLFAFVVLPALLLMAACGKDCDDSPGQCSSPTTPSATTSTVTSSLNPATTAQAVTFTGTVASSGSTPTGTVTFLDGTTRLGTGTLSSGSATFQTSSLAAGTHSITVSYAATTSFKASVSAALTETVNAAAVATATTATVTSSLNPAVSGQAVTFTGTIASSGSTPTGTITFLDGTTQLGTGTLSSGAATFQTSSLTVGTHSITVSYAATSSFKASVSTALTETVNAGAASTAATVTSSLNPAVSGQAVTFTGTVASSGGTPTGTIIFLDGATQLGTGTLSSGSATFQTSSLTSGTHSITVSYAGATSFTASTSPALTETVDNPGTPLGTYTIPINAIGTAGSNNGNTGQHDLSVSLTVR